MSYFSGTKFTDDTIVSIDNEELTCTITGTSQIDCVVNPTTAGSFPVEVRDRIGGNAILEGGISTNVTFG